MPAKPKVYRFRSNSDLCLTGYLWQMLPGVIAYGIQFDLNPYQKRQWLRQIQQYRQIEPRNLDMH